MKRHSLPVLLFLMMLHYAGASQIKEPAFYHWNVGISAGDILHRLFNVEDNNRAYAAFVIEYSGNKYSLQAGFRPGYNRVDTDHEGFMDTEITDQLSLSGHLALTRNIFSETRWVIKAGLRYEGGWSKEDIIEDSGFDMVTTTRLQWNGGAGPVLDFRFFVHPRISLGTDAALIYAYSESELQQHFTNFPDFNTTKETIIQRELNVLEPVTIYLRFHL